MFQLSQSVRKVVHEKLQTVHSTDLHGKSIPMESFVPTSTPAPVWQASLKRAAVPLLADGKFRGDLKNKKNWSSHRSASTRSETTPISVTWHGCGDAESVARYTWAYLMSWLHGYTLRTNVFFQMQTDLSQKKFLSPLFRGHHWSESMCTISVKSAQQMQSRKRWICNTGLLNCWKPPRQTIYWWEYIQHSKDF